MSHRASPPQRGAQRPASHVADLNRQTTSPRGYTLAHAGRQVRLGPVAFWITVSVLVIMAVWSGATATYFTFRDDLLTRLIGRQASMQYAYEDRITELRAQIDRLTSHQLLDQEQVEGRIAQLARRQATLETRAGTLATIPDANATGSIRPRAHMPGRHEETPVAKPSPISDRDSPRPLPERQSMFGTGLFGSARADTALARTVESKLARIDQSLDRVESRQNAALAAVADSYDGKIRHMRGLLTDVRAATGKDMKVALPAEIGGPFVPANLKSGSAFERLLQRVVLARDDADRLNHTLVALPYRKPLPGDIDITSGFGVRADPFYHAAGMHTGMDMRAGIGEGVHATAAGTVVTAAWTGGYGNMVEIDHGNGFATRYGHLSAILVKPGQSIAPGQIIGRVGSTGRSTGPHLHYETRINGEAVDPEKLLRPGRRFGEQPG